MERKHYMDEFESFLAEKADQYKLYPSDNVWENINKSLHPNRRWPYITAGFLLIGLAFIAERFVLTSSPALKLTSTSGTEQSGPLPSSPNQSVILPGLNSDRQANFSERNQDQGLKTHTAKIISLNTKSGAPTGKNEFSEIVTEPSTRPAISEAVVMNESAARISNNPLAEINDSKTRIADKPSLHPGIAPALLPVSTQGNMAVGNLGIQSSMNPLLIRSTPVHRLFGKSNKWDLEFYVSPTVSYRRLSGDIGSKTAPLVLGSDINNAVNQKPALGAELGTSWIYNVSSWFKLRVGLQINYTHYQIKAYHSAPERAAFAANDNNGFSPDSVRLVSVYRNFSGFIPASLQNEYFQLAAPVGAEISILGNHKLKWEMAATLQPTYNLNNHAFLISTNYKNYAEDPTFIRRWNLATSFETFLSINTGNFKWKVGPQFRYQLLSSYKNQYPFKEYLLDYGFKVGVVRTIK